MKSDCVHAVLLLFSERSSRHYVLRLQRAFSVASRSVTRILVAIFYYLWPVLGARGTIPAGDKFAACPYPLKSWSFEV